MEFMINHECFYKAISDVSKAVSPKTPFPILTGIKITANNDYLILVGSNSDIVIQKVIPMMINGVKILEIYHTGSVVISAKYLSEIVRKLSDKIHIKVSEKQLVTIQSDEIVTQLNGFNSNEYPSLPSIDEAKIIRIHRDELIDMIKQTAFAASKSESRPALTGVNMTFTEKRLTCSATNSHRLALRDLAIKSNITGSYIVPSSSLNDLTKLMDNESDELNIFLTERHIVFNSKTVSLFSRLIEGNYPNVSGLIPNQSKTTITMNTKQLLEGIDRASLFASEWKNNNVHIEIQDGTKIGISSTSSEVGKIEETQYIRSFKGETDLSISLNGSFLMDALKVIKEEEVRLSFCGSMRPVLIEPIGNSNYLHLISPVRS
ncbi:DNA polymerase III subunit beta [Neobacillus terrae]|uniref:DNA polymerase III subunit beta n=1 Tax=Neobacillus terrae TaxID=3034837 RepID=UPI00140A32BC|nr:DNA polymerase III subunit beta [Neobacillus terrae]NHM30808.1 DNA polymerase III subunit beta [Neobacillus terrae]